MKRLKFPAHHYSLKSLHCLLLIDIQKTAGVELVVGPSEGFAQSEIRVLLDLQGLHEMEVLNAAGNLSSVVVSNKDDEGIVVGTEIEPAYISSCSAGRSFGDRLVIAGRVETGDSPCLIGRSSSHCAAKSEH